MIQAPREGAPKSRRPPSTDGGFFLPVNGVRVLKRIFCKASLPESGNKKPRWLLRGLGFLPGRLPPEWGHGAEAGRQSNQYYCSYLKAQQASRHGWGRKPGHRCGSEHDLPE